MFKKWKIWKYENKETQETESSWDLRHGRCMLKMAASSHAATLAWYLPDITHFIARRHNFKMQNELAFMKYYTKKREKKNKYKKINVRMAGRSDL